MSLTSSEIFRAQQSSGEEWRELLNLQSKAFSKLLILSPFMQCSLSCSEPNWSSSPPSAPQRGACSGSQPRGEQKASVKFQWPLSSWTPSWPFQRPCLALGMVVPLHWAEISLILGAHDEMNPTPTHTLRTSRWRISVEYQMLLTSFQRNL